MGVRRRSMLLGAAALSAGGLAACQSATAGAGPEPPHQLGVVTLPPPFTLVTAIDVTAADRAALATTFERLTAAILGSTGVEATVAVGAALFDHRYGLADCRPRRLTAMPSFPGDALDPARCHGDLLLQVCGADATTVAAAVRRMVAVSGPVRWQIAGARHDAAIAANRRPTDRNLFGFREGIGNPDPTDAAEMNRVVWVRGGDEPAWTAGGSYQVVRVIRLATTLWEAEPLARQEAVFGRRKADDVPLGHEREDEAFDYRDDPDGRLVALDAHIRRANPRTPAADGSRMLRRGYSFDRGLDPAGQPDTGIIFICFQQDLERSFATVQRRLTGQALDKYLLPVGGGYFFVLPGLAAGSGHRLGQALLP